LVGQTVDHGNTFDLSAAASATASPAVCISLALAAPPRHRAMQMVPNRDVATAGGMVGT